MQPSRSGCMHVLLHGACLAVACSLYANSLCCGCKCCFLIAGCPTLPIDTEDVIELTIYSGITQVNISNQSGVSDMAVAALSLLPNLGNMSLSGTQLSNLAMYVITTSSSLTKLDLSK